MLIVRNYRYQFAYGLVARHHAAAIVNGTLAPVEEQLIAH
jgi:hypothetical protein